MALKGGSFGDEDYARLTGKAMTDDAKPDPVADTPAPEIGNPEPTPGDNPGGDVLLPPNQSIIPSVFGSGAGGQNINQDNDQSSSVTGDNNRVVQNQDNSINSFGGNSSWKDAWMKDYFA